MLSLRLFNGFRILSEKCEDPEDLKNYVESLAFKHLGIEAAAGGWWGGGDWGFLGCDGKGS